MITLPSLPLAANSDANLTHADVLALLNGYKVAAGGGTAVGTDAVTLAFANALFTYVANRSAVMDELRVAAANAKAFPSSPSAQAQKDQYGNASAELNDGVAATATV